MERLRTAEQTARTEGDDLRSELQNARSLVTKAENEMTALRAKLATASGGGSGRQQGSRGDLDGRIGTTS
jgi:hypothetical protein